jgi:hypothetical protein
VKLATRRLIDASATLPAADRALLSLWTQRGLDDTAMAQMTGVDPATIAERRDRIVAGLSAELGLPPQDVADALSAIAQSAAESLALQASRTTPVEPELGNGGSAPSDAADPILEAISAPQPPKEIAALRPQSQAKAEPVRRDSQARPEPELGGSGVPQRRRRLVGLAAALLGVAVIVIVVVAAASGGGAAHRASVTGATSVTSAASITSSTSVTSSTSLPGSASATTPPAPASNPRTLTPLPGAVAGATGVVTLARGPAGTQRLLVHLSGLPAAGSDHYEVWLYNSIIDSVALGRLGPNGSGSFTLPAVVARFASIDISRQPAGSTLPSGASLLRATNPLAAAPH